MRKLVFILIAIIAAATFIRAFDNAAAEDHSRAAADPPVAAGGQ